MNPGDYLLFVLSLMLATMSLLLNGGTANGIGPALLATAGGGWNLGMQWLRDRNWRRHKDSDFVPGTQHLAIAGWLGWSLAIFPALIWTARTLKVPAP